MIYSQNEEELISIGQKLGRLLDSGDIIVLSGDLGAGKTTLTKGIAKGLDISQMIKSPTYTIVREYEGRLPLYHLDVYRIGDDPDSIDLDDFLCAYHRPVMFLVCLFGYGSRCFVKWSGRDVFSDWVYVSSYSMFDCSP